MDRQVRRNVRMWLRLPKDVAVGYFHAQIKDGGLGIPSLRTTIPELIIRRIGRLHESKYPAARAAYQTRRVQRKLNWATKMLAKFRIPSDGPRPNRKEYWAARLHASVDGYELRESARSPASTKWIGSGTAAIPGRDFVQYVHVHSGSLPTKIRTSRGVRRQSLSVGCRAGCAEDETAAHVIQRCFRTHGGRVLRHNAIVNVLDSGLASKGWQVTQEPHVQTSEGLRKPDLLAVGGRSALVVDAQIVSGARPLDLAHDQKKKYYADNPDLATEIGAKCGVSPQEVAFTTATLSWRGVWSPRSYADLISYGIPPGVLSGIVTRVLRGSHTNWTRFNQMTSTRRPRSTD